MFIQTSAEIVMHVEAHGYVTRGARASALEPDEGLLVDVEAVYELDTNHKPMMPNLVKELSAEVFEQVENALSEAWIKENG